jgi:pilus assembly protein CpaB
MIKNLAIGGGSNRLLLIFALVLGLLCAILVGVYLSGLNSSDTTPATTATTTVPAVVALQDIPPLTVVTDSMLTVKNVPTDLAVLGAFTKPADVVGQTAQVQITAGEQVLPSRVTSAVSAATLYGNNAPLSLLVPGGARAFSIAVSPVASVGGLVRAGDYIDILSGTGRATNADSGTSTVSSCYVLQDVQVLAVGATLANPRSQTDAAALAATLPEPGASVMTVAVTPQNAAVLAAAQGNAGEGTVGAPLWVSLRPFGVHGPAAGSLATCGS